MKKLLLIITLCYSCEVPRPPKNVVQGKYYLTFMGDPLPPGICRFWVNGQEFMDSCNKYNVLDSIQGRIRP